MDKQEKIHYTYYRSAEPAWWGSYAAAATLITGVLIALWILRGHLPRVRELGQRFAKRAADSAATR